MEDINVINKRLLDYFGRFENGEANWKLVWSEDVREKRLMHFTDSGMELLTPEVREVKKFGYIKDRWVLTKLVPVPFANTNELGGAKLSYEPIWTFETSDGVAIEPDWDAIQVLITTWNNTIFSPKKRFTNNRVPLEKQNTAEGMKYRAAKIYEQLYGNETPITDALSRDSAVGYGIRNRK